LSGGIWIITVRGFVIEFLYLDDKVGDGMFGEEQKQRLAQIFWKYPNVKAVYLFGSHARGTAVTTSDLDLGVFKVLKGASARIYQGRVCC
jgi:hypothetical protein